MPAQKLNIAIISDLHCKYKSTDNGQRTTRLYSDMLRSPASKHPVQSLINLIDSKAIEADILLCPGDITDKIDLQGYVTGWSFLEEMKVSLKASEIYATLGNHDVNSRQFPQCTVFEYAQGLKNNYPFNNQEAKNSFWADHFSVITINDITLLIFNTVHNFINKEEADNTKITDGILEKMQIRLDQIGDSSKFKIAMCHHHPIQHANITYKDGDVMDKGDKFLDLLNRNKFQVLIHGHKHEPKLRYYNSLPVFCSGSFSSLMNIQDTQSDNVFHILTLEEKSPYGTIKTWSWTVDEGWKTDVGQKFPILTGFGYRDNINTLATQINTWMVGLGLEIQPYPILIQNFPQISYLIPDDKKQLDAILLNQYNIEFTITPSLPDTPRYICRQIQ